MKNIVALPGILLLGMLLASPVMAAEAGEEFDPLHHVADGYYLDLQPIAKLQLPRLFLIQREGGGLDFKAFWSTNAAVASGEFHVVQDEHGEEGETDGLAETPAAPYEVTEERVGEGSPIQHARPMVAGSIHLESELEPLDGRILIDFSITRHLVFAILGALIVFAIFFSMARRYRRGIGRTSAPRGVMQNMMETLVVFIRDEVARPNLGDKYHRFLPYLLTAFFFILTCNLLGLVPFGATATSNLMITAVLAATTFIITQFSASKDHWMHVFWPPGVPTFVKPILIPVEILGLFTKPFALAIRLFANLTAGHLVILSLIGLIFSFGQMFGPAWGYGVAPVSVAFSLFIYLLEILVGFIQAYIFTMLSALFIGMAVAEHEHADHDEYQEGVMPELTEEDHTDATPHVLVPQGRTSETREPAPVA